MVLCSWIIIICNFFQGLDAEWEGIRKDEGQNRLIYHHEIEVTLCLSVPAVFGGRINFPRHSSPSSDVYGIHATTQACSLMFINFFGARDALNHWPSFSASCSSWAWEWEGILILPPSHQQSGPYLGRRNGKSHIASCCQGLSRS